MSVHIAEDVSFQEFIKEHPNVIVKYYADWCGSCRLFAPKFKRLAQDERFKGISFLDVNAEKNPESRKLGSVKNLPSFALFKDGTLVETVATSNEEAVIELLQKLI